jgi:hypothetical protein
MKRKSFLILIISVLILALGVSAIAKAQGSTPNEVDAPVGSAFTYQGQLEETSGPVTGTCDFQFSLCDAPNSGCSSPLTQTGITVSEGLFTVQLDFGVNAFNGNARWLEIAVRCPAGSGSYTTLSPSQPLSPAPYASYALSAGNADTLDGQHADALKQHYQNLVVVAKSGGDFTTITDALNSITTNSATNPFTIYIAPGVYSETVTMKPYVDIEGAGETSTKITYTGSPNEDTATIIGADHAEIRYLTVENIGGDIYAVGIINANASPHMTHLTIIASGATGSYPTNIGAYNDNSSPVMLDMNITASGTAYGNAGVSNVSASPTMENVNITVSGGYYTFGVLNNLSSPTMMNVTAAASGGSSENIGVRNDYSSPTMTSVNATVSGESYSNYGVLNNNSSPTMMNVTATSSGGTYTYGVYNDYSSPAMTSVNATASGGSDTNYGVYNLSASPNMTNITAIASGGANTYGVYNTSSSSPTMINVNASASGGTNGYGMWNTNSSPKIQNSVMYGEGSYTGDGIHNSATVSGSYILEINNSQVSGGSSTIYSESSDYTTLVGASQLVGNGGMGPGHYICVLSYDGNYSSISNICQP